MAERILVTGGAGFIGSHLVRRLLRDGAEVTVLDDLSRGRLDDATGDARIVQHDLTRPIPEGLLAGDFDGVYHLAAVVGVARVTNEPQRVLDTNLAATQHLLRWLDGHPPRALFLASTSEVADGAVALGLAGHPTPEEVPFVLAHPRAPRSCYALSKATAESLVLHRADRTRVRVGRFYNVYGPRMGHSHVIPQFATRVLSGQDPFQIFGAYQTRAFCYIDDAIEAAVGLMRLPDSRPIVANIGNDREEIEIIELAWRMLRRSGSNPAFDIADPPPGSPQRRLPDLRVIRRLLPPWQLVPLESGLDRVLAWYAREHDRAARS